MKRGATPSSRAARAAPPGYATGQPRLAAAPGRSQLAEPTGGPSSLRYPTPWPAAGLTKPEDRPGLTEPQDRPGLTEPEDRVLLPEPPERPASGTRQVPAFRSRRPAATGTRASRRTRTQTGRLPRCRPGASGWTVISYLIAGIIAYGGIGWLVSRAVHSPVIFPVGMLFGLGVSLGLVIYRYGRSSSTQNQHAKETLREEPAGDR